MKKLRIPIILVFIAVVIIVGLFLWMYRDKNTSKPSDNLQVVPELSEETQAFLEDIGTTVQDTTIITIENNQYTEKTGNFLLKNPLEDNKLVFVNKSEKEAQIYIVEQPEGSTLPVAYIINPHGSLATTIIHPGTYRFSLLDNLDEGYILFVTTE